MKKYKGGLNFGTKGKQGGGNKDLFPMHNGVTPGPMYRSPTKKITLSSGDPEEELRKKAEEGPKEKVKKIGPKKPTPEQQQGIKVKERDDVLTENIKDTSQKGDEQIQKKTPPPQSPPTPETKGKNFFEKRLDYMKSEEGRATSDIVNKMANMFRPERYGKLPTDQANQQRNALRTDLLNEQKEIELDDYKKSKIGDNDMEKTQKASITPEGKENLDKGYVASTETSTAAQVARKPWGTDINQKWKTEEEQIKEG